MRNTFATILALLLIICGVIIVGLAGVRIWQAGSFLRMDINTADRAQPAVSVDTAGTAAATTLNLDLLDAPTAEPLVQGVESGSMLLATQEPLTETAMALSSGAPVEPTVVPVATADPCPPQPEGGFPAAATVTVIGMASLYPLPDLFSTPLGQFTAGQAFLVTGDPSGITALRRCDLVWVRVSLGGSIQGWVLGSAVQIAEPTPLPTVAPTPYAPICPGGCATPTCGEPCYNPCQQPCSNPCLSPCTQPCPAPCGVYTQ